MSKHPTTSGLTPSTPISQVPGTAAPLHRALSQAGYTVLSDLDGVSYVSLLALHGVGKVGLQRVQAALEGAGLSMRMDRAVWSSTDRGEKPVGRGTPSKDIKTSVTEVSPAEWVESLPEAARREAGRDLLRIFGEATGAEPRMWGPSMVGYGEMHYRYESGREGTSMRLGFSPRKGAISLYGLQMYGSNADLVAQLGKHRLGKGCLYVNKLADVDEEVLRELIRRAWNEEAHATGGTC